MTHPRRLARLAVVATVATAASFGIAACAADKVNAGPGVPTTIAVGFSGGTVSAEIAATFAARETGLMNRTSIAADSGMLFVWAADKQHQFASFWMKNTHFDLAIAFLDANKKVINIEEMTKDTETPHFATAPFRYALEAPKGWFAAHGVVAGATASFTLPAGTVIDP